jgi:hypothetical protein
MSVGEFLARLTRILDGANIPTMFCGSIASTYYGMPRTTQDVDLVVDLRPDDIPRLLAAFPEDEYYVSEDAVREAVKRRTQFNIIDFNTGWKADLIVRRARPFSAEELTRRKRVAILGAEVWLATAEDTVLAKLEWAALSDSERQERDVTAILRIRGENLDWAYMERWADELGVRHELRRLQENAKDK